MCIYAVGWSCCFVGVWHTFPSKKAPNSALSSQSALTCISCPHHLSFRQQRLADRCFVSSSFAWLLPGLFACSGIFPHFGLFPRLTLLPVPALCFLIVSDFLVVTFWTAFPPPRERFLLSLFSQSNPFILHLWVSAFGSSVWIVVCLVLTTVSTS